MQHDVLSQVNLQIETNLVPLDNDESLLFCQAVERVGWCVQALKEYQTWSIKAEMRCEANNVLHILMSSSSETF